MQICACKAIYALTPEVGHDVLQPVLNALYEGKPTPRKLCKGALNRPIGRAMQSLLMSGSVLARWKC